MCVTCKREYTKKLKTLFIDNLCIHGYAGKDDGEVGDKVDEPALEPGHVACRDHDERQYHDRKDEDNRNYATRIALDELDYLCGAVSVRFHYFF